ncbi:hypothetical protein SGLAM104S_06754 [Streptomyces glaucescens]
MNSSGVRTPDCPPPTRSRSCRLRTGPADVRGAGRPQRPARDGPARPRPSRGDRVATLAGNRAELVRHGGRALQGAGPSADQRQARHRRSGPSARRVRRAGASDGRRPPGHRPYGGARHGSEDGPRLRRPERSRSRLRRDPRGHRAGTRRHGVHEGDIAVPHFTSGSTGKLKAAVQTYGNRLALMRKSVMSADTRIGPGSPAGPGRAGHPRLRHAADGHLLRRRLCDRHAALGRRGVPRHRPTRARHPRLRRADDGQHRPRAAERPRLRPHQPAPADLRRRADVTGPAKADRGDNVSVPEANMCKLFTSEACFRVADQAVQISHGSAGLRPRGDEAERSSAACGCSGSSPEPPRSTRTRSPTA